MARKSGVTPQRVVDLLTKAVGEKSQSAVARESGLALFTVQRYLKGIGEPTHENLRKLADYFDVSVPWLRGDDPKEYEEAKKRLDDSSYQATIRWIVYNKDELIMSGPCALVAHLFGRTNEKVLDDLRRAGRHNAAENDKEPMREKAKNNEQLNSRITELSLSEFLNNEENQIVVLEKIINMLRKNEEWGRHGLFAKIAEQTGFSQAYIGRVLTGKQPLRENFVEKIAGYLGVSVHWLRGEDSRDAR